MIYQAEKVLKDNGDKIPADIKSEVEGKMEVLRGAAKGSDVAALRRAMDEFNDALQKVGQHIYQGGASGGGPEAGGNGTEPQAKPETEDEVVDADYREVN